MRRGYLPALVCSALLTSTSANAELIHPLNEDGTSRLAFTATGFAGYEYRPEYTTLNGRTNAGYERLRFSTTFRAQYAFADIGDPLWTEINFTGRINKIDPMDGGNSSLDMSFGNDPDASFGATSATIGTGAFYGFVANGAVQPYGPGAGHTGGFPKSAAGTGFYDTFQRIHGDTGGRDDDILLAGDVSGLLNFVSEDQGGTNSETFLGFGYVTDTRHYAVQASENGEWKALSFGQKLTPTLGVSGTVYQIDSTNRRGRAVDDRGFDLILTHVTDKVEYGARLTGWGYGPSPVWNAEQRRRLRLSSSYAINERHAIGFNFDFEDFPVINATTGAAVREQNVRRLTVMYGYHLNEYSFLTGQAVRTETDVQSGSLAGNSQTVSQIRLAYNYIF